MSALRYLRTAARAVPTARSFATSLRSPSAFNPQPSPPRLPKEEQEIFEKLLRDNEAAGAFAVPRDAPGTTATDEKANMEDRLAELRAKIAAKGDGEELHPNVRRGAPPEFEGDTNPKTGEVGGPKNDPLRWQGDWAYNGRVTDF